jgi:hypothetical protein
MPPDVSAGSAGRGDGDPGVGGDLRRTPARPPAMLGQRRQAWRPSHWAFGGLQEEWPRRHPPSEVGEVVEGAGVRFGARPQDSPVVAVLGG